MKFCLVMLAGLILLSGCRTKSANDYFVEAEILEGQAKYKEAIALLDKAIGLDQKFLGAYINRLLTVIFGWDIFSSKMVNEQRPADAFTRQNWRGSMPQKKI